MQPSESVTLALDAAEMAALRALLEHRGTCKTLVGDFASPNRRNAAFLRGATSVAALRRIEAKLRELFEARTTGETP
jgi:hypothetical protein